MLAPIHVIGKPKVGGASLEPGLAAVDRAVSDHPERWP